MRLQVGSLTRKALPVLATALPVMLILSAFRAYWALDAQRFVFLQSRAAALAAHLETLDAVPESEWEEFLAAEDPTLARLEILTRTGPGAPELDSLWEGRELFRTERVRDEGVALYRAYVPFHAGGGLRLARIDLRESGADFLVEHALHHLLLVLAGGTLIVALTVVNARSNRRAAAAEREQIRMTHLAHLGEMSAVLAHEIRNPLGTIKGYAQLLGERTGEDQRGLVAPILSETIRLEALVRDLLLYGRPAEPQPREVRSSELARTLEQHTQHLTGAAGIDLRVTLAEFTLQTDPGLLEQILLNLLRNGVEAARGTAGARVRLAGAAAAGEVVFTVCDSGPGFTAEAERRLFEPFFTTKASGTGLGLSISRKLAEALGGRLTMANDAGGGARVELRLPLSWEVKHGG